MSNLKILYQDQYLVAIDKPVGMIVHRTKLAKDVKAIATKQLRRQLGQKVYSLHRLDRPTSGVLLFALDQETARKTTRLFERHEIGKNYIALARGHCLGSGRVNMPLVEMLDKTTDSLACQGKGPQEATTDYECLVTTEYPHPVGRYPTARYSLLRIAPKTGRRHQIRRHLKHINHPIIGDRKHGDRDHNAFFLEHFNVNRMLLVAKQLFFEHPVTHTVVRIEASIGEEFSRALALLGIATSE